MRSIAAIRPAQIAAVASATLIAGVAGFAGVAAQANAAVAGSSLKKGSLPANRIKPNSLTGVQINEARLGLVPVAKLAQFAELAKSADSARTAESARAAETARTAESARAAEVAREAQRLNGRESTAFLANTIRTVSRQTGEIPGGGVPAEVSVSCPEGEKAIGGGGAWIVPVLGGPSALEVPITASMPQPEAPGVNGMTGWTVAGRNLSAVRRILRVYAICVPLNP